MTDIWVPNGFTKDEGREVLACLVCGAEFETDHIGDFTRHVAGCAKRNETEIDEQLNEAILARKMPGLFGPEAGDVELERWFKEHRDEILEYRLKP